MPKPIWTLIDSTTGEEQTFERWRTMVEYADRRGLEIQIIKNRERTYCTIKLDIVPPIDEWLAELEKREELGEKTE